jgi:ParB family chromosome partitioning protein
MLDQPSKLFDILQMIEDHGLSVREIERIVRDHEEKPDVDTSNMEVPGEPARPETDPYIEDAKKRMRDTLGTKVTLLPKSKGGGTIHITYHDDEELDRLLNIIAPPGPASYRKLGE